MVSAEAFRREKSVYVEPFEPMVIPACGLAERLPASGMACQPVEGSHTAISSNLPEWFSQQRFPPPGENPSFFGNVIVTISDSAPP